MQFDKMASIMFSLASALTGVRVLLMVFGSDDVGGATSQSDSSLTHALSRIFKNSEAT